MTVDRISDRYAGWLAQSNNKADRSFIPHLIWHLGDRAPLEELNSAAADWFQIASGAAPPGTVERRLAAANLALLRMTPCLNAPDRRHEQGQLTEAIQHATDEVEVLNAIIGQRK